MRISDWSSDVCSSDLTAYRGMENSGNPWGMSQSDRAAWTSKVDGVPIVEGGDSLGHEYLYWVGCAGSFHDPNMKVLDTMATRLTAAWVASAMPGPASQRTGHRSTRHRARPDASR